MFYREILKYLQTDPNEDFISSEKERLSKIIKNKESQYGVWLFNFPNKNLKQSQYKTLFKKEVGIDVLKRQLKNIEFLLN